MHDALRHALDGVAVDVTQGPQHAGHHVDRLTHLPWLAHAARELGQRHALDELHREERAALVLAHVEYGHHVAVTGERE